ncbi:UNVERIFIED_CONTAM: hypothetical protein GTU68_048471 [Idotea baltica]|nr:hypothetical protein [Idotea baltica]
MYVAGIDEAGRGPLAGPVSAAAVVLKPDTKIDGLTDSKKLSDAQRQKLYPEIIQSALAYSIIMLGPREIEQHNIRQATLLAMQAAATEVEKELKSKCFFLIDGNMNLSKEDYLSEFVIKGDRKIRCISAASILAKVTRDREMVKLDEIYPGYGFRAHKGYPTAAHREQIKLLGPTEIHRRTFAGVKEYITEES